ncbi:MAG TPA: pyridoxal-phosphate dependent enzyme [Candidatus Acidoferrum sp.]|nr:pyridoxal-phosphate dependent enzyme [Candidatus Acidoferrum sp.]
MDVAADIGAATLVRFPQYPRMGAIMGAMGQATTEETRKTTEPTWADICAAHERIAPRIHRTPVLTSSTFDRLTGARLYFKCENLQKTGSFKIRGAANTILSLSDEDARRGIVTQSSGNHAAAVACAAGWRGTKAWIVMPKNAPKVKCDAVEGYGGKIAFCEPTVSARKAMCAKVESETGAVLVHPYDDDRVITGAATAAKELLEEVPDLDAVLTPVSGGGLLSGTSLSARHMRPEIRIFGCEPAAANDAYLSLKSGELQTIDTSDTIADGLRASLAPRTFAILRRELAGVLLVSETNIIGAMRMLWERMKIVVEPSSSIVLAPLLQEGGLAGLGLPVRADSLPPKVGLILSGGNVDLSALPFAVR